MIRVIKDKFWILVRKSVFFTGKCRHMMEEEVTDDTMVKFLDSITQQASERLWMLDLGNIGGDTGEDVNVEDIKHGILADNENEALELEKDFKEMNKSHNQNQHMNITNSTIEYSLQTDLGRRNTSGQVKNSKVSKMYSGNDSKDKMYHKTDKVQYEIGESKQFRKQSNQTNLLRTTGE